MAGPSSEALTVSRAPNPAWMTSAGRGTIFDDSGSSRRRTSWPSRTAGSARMCRVIGSVERRLQGQRRQLPGPRHVRHPIVQTRQRPVRHIRRHRPQRGPPRGRAQPDRPWAAASGRKLSSSLLGYWAWVAVRIHSRPDGQRLVKLAAVRRGARNEAARRAGVSMPISGRSPAGAQRRPRRRAGLRPGCGRGCGSRRCGRAIRGGR